MKRAQTNRTACLVCHLILMATVCSAFPATGRGSDWVTWASTYTHEPTTGQRIDQYRLPEQPLGPSRNAVRRSGYRHYRSSLQVGQTADNMHIIEEYGRNVQPYEAWRFPYRPYGVPYDAWGPQAPYGIWNGQGGFGGFWPPYPIPPVANPGVPGQPVVPPGNVTPPGYPGGYPGYGHPGYGGYPGSRPNPYAGSRGFPLQPQYRGQPWFDGTYPSAPPLDTRSDLEFFYHAPLGRKESNPWLFTPPANP